MKLIFFLLLLFPVFAFAQTKGEFDKQITDTVPKMLSKAISARSGDSVGARTVNAPGDTCCWIGRFSIADKLGVSKYSTDSTATRALIATYKLNNDSTSTSGFESRGKFKNDSTTLAAATAAVATTAASKINTANGTFSGKLSGGVYGMVRRAIADVNATIAATDYLIAFTSMTAARTVTLPTASTVSGQYFIIKDESGSASVVNIISIVGTVDGAVNPSAITLGRGVYRIYSNGTNYFSW